MDSWLVSAVWLLWMMLLWVSIKIFLWMYVFISYGYIGVELLGHVVTLFKEVCLTVWGTSDSFTILHSYQQFMRFLISLHPCEHLLALFKKRFIYLFIYFLLFWVFAAAGGLSLVAVSWGYSSLQHTGFSLGGLSCCRAWTLWRVGSSQNRDQTCVLLHWQADS